MDFVHFAIRDGKTKNDPPEIFPDFVVGRSQDLMVRGKSFYAIWDEEKGLWSTDEYDVQRLVDTKLKAEAKRLEEQEGVVYSIKPLRSFSNGGWANFQKFVKNVSDNSKPLDDKLTFQNTEVKKSDYVTKRLPYPLEEGDISAWDELIGTLYSVEERAKIEWTIGAVVSGDSKKIQKFAVFYGPAGTGKSTVLNIIEQLFTGYTTTFEAKSLGSNNAAFATEVFKGNPLVAIQHDGDLSKIEDNTKLNSIVSHEQMTMNEKYKASYTGFVNAFLLIGSNQPVKITDSKSGLIRRLIDIHPTGVKIPPNHYTALISRIEFELGAIAWHCLQVYLSMGKNHYNNYRPLEMMLQTDVFFNFIEYYFDIFKEQDSTTLKQAYTLYKEFCSETGIERPMPQYKLREELRNYFDDFREKATIDGHQVRSYYSGFNANKFKAPLKNENAYSLVIEEHESLLDVELAQMPAQLANDMGTPRKRWSSVNTTLSDLDTHELHFVKVPENHIVIDFDLKDTKGEKSLERNLEAASVWPATYAELSKSGAGVHLHYIYDGDVTELRSDYSEGIEVKVYTGDSSLRRRLSKCNAVPISVINSGLPLKEKKMLDAQTMTSERGLRELIMRNLRKEIHPHTKPSVDFIKHILDEAYESGMSYDVTDLRSRIMAFAANSGNQAIECLRVMNEMKFTGMDGALDNPNLEGEGFMTPQPEAKDDRLVFYDLEVYPNLFVVCWKYEDSDNVQEMINPSSSEVEELFGYKLVGFYNRRYDNHIAYARFMGYSNEELFKLSQKIVNNTPNSLFGEAYNLSYTDVYDYASEKKTLKRWEIELGIKHMEMDIPWDQPVPEDKIRKVVEYCKNDVRATEAVHKARLGDYNARLILSELSGLTPNHTTNAHTTAIIFGNEKNPHDHLRYTDLAEIFPGYVFDAGKSMYRDENPGEGGYVYAEPGIHENVALLDVASMHPTSIEELELFGPKYTPRFSALKNARLAIKRGSYDEARTMLNGALAPYLSDDESAKALSDALKIAINSVYGLTSASFANAFRDKRNIDNIVAKRGALFMIDLKHAVQEQGFVVAHIKTDSIKIPNATPEIIQFVMDFGKQAGYEFEHEATYSKMCLVNEAVYIARYGWHATKPSKIGTWEAVGAQFQHPYVFKQLFSHQEIEFRDMCETKQVQKGVMYLDFGSARPMFEDDNSMVHVGKSGLFVPVTEGSPGGVLLRVDGEKAHAVTGTKGYLWLESEMLMDLPEGSYEIDVDYFEKLSSAAVNTIEKFGSYEDFIKE